MNPLLVALVASSRANPIVASKEDRIDQLKDEVSQLQRLLTQWQDYARTLEKSRHALLDACNRALAISQANLSQLTDYGLKNGDADVDAEIDNIRAFTDAINKAS